jgi:hypothetical protein
LLVVSADCGSDLPDALSAHPVDAVENGENATILSEFQVTL